MHALIVLAHPEEHSFTAAMAHTAKQCLETAGWTVDLDDLHREGFTGDLARDDLDPVPDEDLVQLMWAQDEASARDGYAPSLLAQMQRLQAADLLIVAFPLWWYAMPGILKSWFDRVFASGVGYGPDAHADGPLRGKRALALVAVGAEAEDYGPEGTMGDIIALLNPLLYGTFDYAAMDVLEPFLAFNAGSRRVEHRAALLDALRERLIGVDSEAPIRPKPLDPQ